MREQIGSVAGKIWETLGEKEEINLATLTKTLKEKSDVVYQGLGWLAREDKIKYQTKGDKVFVSLTDTERDAFNKSHLN